MTEDSTKRTDLIGAILSFEVRDSWAVMDLTMVGYICMGKVVVFAPSPVVSVTVEDHNGSGPEIHIHAAGQGIWQARMLKTLGIDVIMCCVLAGETGDLLRHMIEGEGIELRAVDGCAGDSLTAGVAAALADGATFTEGVTLGSAAGALNVTRHGLGSGNRDTVHKLRKLVDVKPYNPRS